jgi:hypothetical protein
MKDNRVQGKAMRLDKQTIAWQNGTTKYLRFQVLTAASMMFRIVFWDVLPCKMIVD